jgi:oligoribonuclease (3'-5' exoribonuclease)
MVHQHPGDVFNQWVAHPRYDLSPGVAANPRFMENVRLAELQGADVYNSRTRLEAYLRETAKKFLPTGEEIKFTVVGKNFWRVDGPFLKTLGLDVDRYFHHRSIDVGTLALRPTDEVPPGLEETFKRAGITFAPETLHDALVDATCCAMVYQKWLNGSIKR